MEKDVEVTETVEQADMPRGTDEEDGKGKPGGGGGHRIQRRRGYGGLRVGQAVGRGHDCHYGIFTHYNLFCFLCTMTSMYSFFLSFVLQCKRAPFQLLEGDRCWFPNHLVRCGGSRIRWWRRRIILLGRSAVGLKWWRRSSILLGRCARNFYPHLCCFLVVLVRTCLHCLSFLLGATDDRVRESSGNTQQKELITIFCWFMV